MFINYLYTFFFVFKKKSKAITLKESFLNRQYIKDKEIILKKFKSKQQFLFKTLVIFAAIFSVWLMITLLSFHPSDPSWLQTSWCEPVHNLGGISGAWFSSTFFFIFGITAYFIPVIIFLNCLFIWRHWIYRNKVNYFLVFSRLIGTLLLILSCCGLAAINTEDIWYFSSGGIIGSLLNITFQPMLYKISLIIALLCTLSISLMLFTGWSWIKIFKKISGSVINVLNFTHTHLIQDDVMINHEINNVKNDICYNSERFHILHEKMLVHNERLKKKTVNPSDYNKPISSRFSKKIKHYDKKCALIKACRKTKNFNMMKSHKYPRIQFLSEKRNLSEDESFFSIPILKTSLKTTVQSDDKLVKITPQTIHSKETIKKHSTIKWFSAPSLKTPDPVIMSEPNNYITPIFHDILEYKGSYQTLGQQTYPESSKQTQLMREKHFQTQQNTSELVKKTMLKENFSVEKKKLPRSSFTVFQAEQKKKHFHERERPTVQQYQTNFESVKKEVTENEYTITPQLSLTEKATSTYSIIPHAQETSSPLTSITDTDLTFNLETKKKTIYSQVKDGIGPHLPRPNRIRIPTRRELAFYNMFSKRIFKEKSYKKNNKSDDIHQTYRFQNKLKCLSISKKQQVHQNNNNILDHCRITYKDNSTQLDLVNQFAILQKQYFPEKYFTKKNKFPLTDLNFFLSKSKNHESSRTFSQMKNVASKISMIEQSLKTVSKQQSNFCKNSTHSIPIRNNNFFSTHRFTSLLPSLNLLILPPEKIKAVNIFSLQKTARLLETRLADFHIKADVVNYSLGPVVTRFELNLAPGIKASRISNLSRDLARSLSVVSVRVIEVIPGKPYVGLELPNDKRQIVYLREVLDNIKFRENPSPLTVVLGKDITGEPVISDLAKMSHLLVAGTTGSGKSVWVNSIILNILYKAQPEDVRFIMIDPKMLELSTYEGIPHLLTNVIIDMKDAVNALHWSVNEMERRYKLMSVLGVRNLSDYNEKVIRSVQTGYPILDPCWKSSDDNVSINQPILKKLPYIVIFIDELADLMITVGKKAEELIARLTQKARAAGIHLVLATQRPSVDVITGLIKANIPTRIAFTVSSKIDSRTILDQNGAESLLGMGDMLYSGPNSVTPIRIHGVFVHDQEIYAVVKDWKSRSCSKYLNEIILDSNSKKNNRLNEKEELDSMFDQAVNFVIEEHKVSVSNIQRHFRIGYNRAIRIIKQMETQGIVSQQGYNGNRKILIKKHIVD